MLNNVDNFKYINIAYAFDNNYYYITHVSMKSIMLYQKKIKKILLLNFIFYSIKAFIKSKKYNRYNMPRT